MGTFGSPSTLVGLPRRMGVISGMLCFSSVGGARNAPANGGVATSGPRGANAGFVEPLIESGQRISASVSNDLVS